MTPFFACSDVTIYNADARTAADLLEPDSVDAVVTSPPYFGLRDYGVDGQLGLEDSPEDYIEDLADLLTTYAGPLKPGGSLWLNIGDSYANDSKWGGSTGGKHVKHLHGMESTGRHRKQTGYPDKCMLMIPERVALAMISRGWILRNRVVWAKPNGMPESVKDRLAGKHEALFHFVRQGTYHYDLDAIREPHAESTLAAATRARKPYQAPGQSPNLKTREMNEAGANPGDVWTIPTQPYPEAHFAVYPPELVRRPILATVPAGGTVLDPFFGAGTTAVMARRLGRNTVGIELSEDYCELAAERFRQEVLNLEGA